MNQKKPTGEDDKSVAEEGTQAHHLVLFDDGEEDNYVFIVSDATALECKLAAALAGHFPSDIVNLECFGIEVRFIDLLDWLADNDDPRHVRKPQRN
jgi:hypothetical protein